MSTHLVVPVRHICHIQADPNASFQGPCHIDHNMTFGSHSAPNIWCSFFGLVIWITIHVLYCTVLLHYNDDMWSYETDPTLVYYSPYDAYYSHKQVKILELHDYL